MANRMRMATYDCICVNDGCEAQAKHCTVIYNGVNSNELKDEMAQDLDLVQIQYFKEIMPKRQDIHNFEVKEIDIEEYSKEELEFILGKPLADRLRDKSIVLGGDCTVTAIDRKNGIVTVK